MEEREVEKGEREQTDGEREIDTKRDGGRMRAVERMIKGKVCWREREKGGWRERERERM